MPSHAGRRRISVERTAASIAHNHDHDYSALLEGVRASFAAVRDGPLFVTDATGLNELYLNSLPSERQVHNCHACQHFIERFGSLATIREDSKLTSAMWSAVDIPDFYRGTFEALAAEVARAKVVSVFYNKLETWGTPVTGSWSHVAVTPPRSLVYREGALNAEQAMAVSRENFRTVLTALTDFKPAALDQALRLFDAEALDRSEKFASPVRWLRQLQDRPRGRAGDNLVWRAVATAPEGYCHPKSSVIGPLLSDITAGLPFDDIKTKFAAMLHPLRYQRPQAAPAAGAIRVAEVLVEKLGIARSLERRFALLDEIETFWVPKCDTTPKGGGIFAHIRPRGVPSAPPVSLPTTTSTWEKFVRTVLPVAERLEMLMPANGNFEAYLTAAHADSPLIFKWSNPFSTYVYNSGSMPSDWGLQYNSWAPVLAVAQRPNMWGGESKPYLGEGVLLVLMDAVDRRTDQGNALFPEMLRDDIHGVRSVVESYSKSAVIGRPEGQYASGYGIIKKSGNINVTLRAFLSGAWSSYHIDHWD